MLFPFLSSSRRDRGEDLPDFAAVDPAIKGDQDLTLRRGGALIENHLSDAIPCVDGTGPPKDLDKAHAMQPCIADMDLLDREDNKPFMGQEIRMQAKNSVSLCGLLGMQAIEPEEEVLNRHDFHISETGFPRIVPQGVWAHHRPCGG